MLRSLRAARSSMAVQVNHIATPVLPDRERLQRLHVDAEQFAHFARAVLSRMRRDGSQRELLDEALELLSFFDEAARRVAIVLDQSRQ